MEEGDTGSSDMQAGMVSSTLFCCQFLICASQIFKKSVNVEVYSFFYLMCHPTGLTVADLVFPW